MCENCKFYKKETNFIGKCDKIKMMVMPTIPIDEAKDFESYVDLMVRKEFECNQLEKLK